MPNVTNGMSNVFKNNNSVLHCSSCGLNIPKYPGRYPSSCPECGSPLELISVDDQEQCCGDEENLEDIDDEDIIECINNLINK